MATTLQWRNRTTIAALFSALALPVLAQSAVPTPTNAAPAPVVAAADTLQPQAREHAQHPKRQHGAVFQKRMERLKEQLKLTEAQQPAWASYVEALQPPARIAQAERPARSDWKQLTTPERIDRMQTLRAQHAAAQDRRDAATKTFYATLSAEQQKTFDAQFVRSAGKHHGPHHFKKHPGHAPHQGQQPAAPQAPANAS